MRTLSPRTKRARKSVKLRTNGKHKIKGASVNAPVELRRILRPQARYNWMLPSLAAITPQYIETVLNGALAGNFVQQWELFDLMLRTWPELSACCGELREGVLRKKLVFEPYCEEDEKPTPTALEKQRLVSTALRQMQPDTEHDGNDLNGTLTNILDAWLRGVSVSEIVWQNYDDPKLQSFVAPFSTYWVNPVFYAFSSDSTLGLRPKNERKDQSFYPYSTTAATPVYVDPFPPNKFLVAVHKAKAGSPLSGALLVPLAWWWCAANFSSDWLLNLAQLFGLPFRWANYDPNAPQATIDAICQMLQNMGSAGWAAFPTGTTLELQSPSQNGSDHSPQGELLDRADRYARLLILGQTMTGTHGTTGKGGGQAFGEVEKDVKGDRIDAAGKFAAEVINRQLIPFILALNYGDTDEMPTIKFLEDEVADLNEAQRDKTLADAGMEIGVDYLRKKYDIPAPADGEETIGGAKPDPFGGGFDQFGNQQDTETPQETKAPNEESDAAKAGDKPGHAFHGNQWTGGQIKKGQRFINPKNGKTYEATTDEFDGKDVQRKTDYSGSRVVWAQPINPKTNKPWQSSDVFRVEDLTPIHSADAGHPFYGNQYVKLGEIVMTPHGKGVVVANTHPDYAYVSINGAVRRVPRSQIKRVPVDKSNFPSITHSAEDERRAALNSKLEELNAISDDKVFARELAELAGIVAGDKPGHPFRGNQYTTGGIADELDPAYSDIHEDARKAARNDLRSTDPTRAITTSPGVGQPHSTMRKQWNLAYEIEANKIIESRRGKFLPTELGSHLVAPEDRK